MLRDPTFMAQDRDMRTCDALAESMLTAIRRVIRAVDLHSRHLAQSHELTGPQALLLRELAVAGEFAPSDLARRISLSQATITDIVKRLERRKLLSKLQNQNDRRRCNCN